MKLSTLLNLTFTVGVYCRYKVCEFSKIIGTMVFVANIRYSKLDLVQQGAVILKTRNQRVKAVFNSKTTYEFFASYFKVCKNAHIIQFFKAKNQKILVFPELMLISNLFRK